MFRKIFLSVFVPGLLLVGCSGSQPSGEGGGDAEETFVVGLSLLTQTHVFYQDMGEAMEAAAAEEGLRLRTQYAEFDSRRQLDQIETFIAQGVDAIIIAPTDSSGVKPVIDEARAKGIPVFTTDIAAHGADVVSHIASDNVGGGKMVAEYLAQQLGGEGKVAIVDHPSVASVQDRTQGFEEVIGQYPDIEIVRRVPGEGQRDKAMRATQDILQAEPELDGIFGINDDSALGALAAVEAAGRADEIVIVGFDGTPEARAAIKAGKALKADAVQFADQVGRVTIETVAAHLRGEEVPAEVPVPVELITTEPLASE
jgi:ribose transport system substrate-binding protein